MTSPNRNNPFVADDVLIKVGAVLTVGSWFIAGGDLRQLAEPSFAGPVFLMGLASLGAGFFFRARERKAVRLLSLLERFPEISVAQLLDGSRLKRNDLERAVATINERGLHYVFWDRKTDTLVDGRLVTGSVVVDDCATCGASIGLNVSLANPSAAICPYCKSGIPAVAIDALRQQRLSALDVERAHEREIRLQERELQLRERAPPVSGVKEVGKFNVVLFLVLFVVIPPVGIGYAIYSAWRAKR